MAKLMNVFGYWVVQKMREFFIYLNMKKFMAVGKEIGHTQQIF
jgi:hypothetical protein